MFKFIKSVFVSIILIGAISASAIMVYEHRAQIKNEIDLILNPEQKAAPKTEVRAEQKDLNAEWAQRIMTGGYILHFRHAERDKWIDVYMYDALESDVHDNGTDGTRFSENDYFKDAVCLNARGKIQAKAMGEHLENIDFPLGPVVSSPSCRSRQTADITFGGYQALHRILLHKGAHLEDENERIKTLTNLYLNLPMEDGKNTIVSAHNSVVDAGMFANMSYGQLELEEGGFYVISKKDGALHLEYEFHNFKDFIMNFYKR